jgi:hypothetical protein
MIDKADQLLKLALAFAALMVAASVGYYYAIFLPEQARAESERIVQAETLKQQLETKAAEKSAQAKADAQTKYDSCLANAFSNYESRWEGTCKRLNAEGIERRKACFENGYSETYCNSIEITPAKGCALNSALAESYDQGHREAKQLCLEEFKASVPDRSIAD